LGTPRTPESRTKISTTPDSTGERESESSGIGIPCICESANGDAKWDKLNDALLGPALAGFFATAQRGTTLDHSVQEKMNGKFRKKILLHRPIASLRRKSQIECRS
jgi:hypothetical protein